MEKLKIRNNILLTHILSIVVSIGAIIYFLNLIILRIDTTPYYGFIAIVIIFLLLPPLLIAITYLTEDLNKTIILNHEKNELIIQKNNKTITIRKKDILDSYFVFVDRPRFSKGYYFWGEYLCIILKDKERIYITDLYCKPKQIIDFLKLKTNNIETRIPFLDRKLGELNLTTDEIEKKVKEFIVAYKDKTDDELIEICKKLKSMLNMQYWQLEKYLMTEINNTTAKFTT